MVGMAKAVGQSLDTLAPLSTYTNRNVVTKYGHIVGKFKTLQTIYRLLECINAILIGVGDLFKTRKDFFRMTSLVFNVSLCLLKYHVIKTMLSYLYKNIDLHGVRFYVHH